MNHLDRYTAAYLDEHDPSTFDAAILMGSMTYQLAAITNKESMLTLTIIVVMSTVVTPTPIVATLFLFPAYHSRFNEKCWT